MLLQLQEEPGAAQDLGPPFDTSTIHWKALEDGIVFLDLFGGIGRSLAAVLKAGIKVKRYIYVDIDDAAQHGFRAKQHSQRLKTQFPDLLTTSAIKTACSTLIGDIALFSPEDIHCVGHVDLVTAGWPCQGISMAGNQNGLKDTRSL